MIRPKPEFPSSCRVLLCQTQTVEFNFIRMVEEEIGAIRFFNRIGGVSAQAVNGPRAICSGPWPKSSIARFQVFHGRALTSSSARQQPTQAAVMAGRIPAKGERHIAASHEMRVPLVCCHVCGIRQVLSMARPVPSPRIKGIHWTRRWIALDAGRRVCLETWHSSRVG